MNIQLRKPFFPPKSIIKIKKEIGEVLKNGRLTLGHHVDEFELKFASYLKMKYAVGVSSATAGLHLSLLSLNIKPQEEVIVPAKTFISTANAAIYCNAIPVFCDVDEESYQLDPSKLEKLITKKTRAIIPVHLGGNICPMKEILRIANTYRIPVIEDCSHSHGSTLNRKKAGSFGKIGVFSFYPDKVMASSDGGIVTTNSPQLYHKIRLLRNVGREKIGKFDFGLIGYNYRMNEIQAIIAKEQLRLLPQMLRMRRRIAKIYDYEFSELKNIKKTKISSKVKGSYYAYIMRIVKGNSNNLRQNLRNHGIETSPMFTTIYKTKPYIKIFGTKVNRCPVSEKLDNQTFTIPLHPGMKKNEISYVINIIKKLVT